MTHLGEGEIARAGKYQSIRLMTIKPTVAPNPVLDARVSLQWSLPAEGLGPASRAQNPTFDNLGDSFSAVCWYFGKSLHLQLNVPIGLIAAAWGGTSIEAWMPSGALAPKAGKVPCNAGTSPPWRDMEFVVGACPRYFSANW